MNLAAIESLVQALEASSALELEYEEAGVRLRLRRSSRVEAPLIQSDSTTNTITSPAAGRLFSAHPLSAVPRHFPCDVTRGEFVGFLQVGPFLSGVQAPADGRLLDRLFDEGSVVGFGDALYAFVQTS
jgi:acetyl-CoA carboxylase biotin carboxyl carrier protein